MASIENAQARALWEGLVASLTPAGDTALTVDELRAGFDAWAADSMPVPDGAELEPVDADGVACIWARMPGTSRIRTILYSHGGGYVLGSATAYSAFGAALSKAADAQVLVVDYRRAPEHPHPAALEDFTTAYRWLLKQGLSPADIVIAGDSAGGGLTTALLVNLRDQGEPLPAGGVPISPWVDMTFSAKSYDERADVDPIISRELLGTMAQLWLGDQDPHDIGASPIFADLTGLPPLAIFVGTSECLYDEALDLYRKAEASGVKVDLHLGEGMFHIWPVMSSFLPEAKEAVQQIGAFVRERTGPAPARMGEVTTGVRRFFQSSADADGWEPFLVGDMSIGEFHSIRESGSDPDSVLQVALWRSEPQTFPYTFEDDETLYLIEGSVEVEYPDGEVVRIAPGDVVSFAKGESTIWRILTASKKLFVVAG